MNPDEMLNQAAVAAQSLNKPKTFRSLHEKKAHLEQQILNPEFEMPEGPTAQEEILRAAMELQAKDTPVDLKPVQQLADFWSGSNFASNMKPPETPLDEAAKIIKALPKDARAKKDDLLNEFAKLHSLTKPDNAGNEIDRKEKQFDRRLRTQILNIAAGDMRKIQEQYATDTSQLSSLSSIIEKPGGPTHAEVTSALANLARTVGGEKGALSEGDVRRQLLQDWETRAGSLISEISGTPGKVSSKLVLDQLRGLIARGQEVAQAAAEARAAAAQARSDRPDAAEVFAPDELPNYFQKQVNQLKQKTPAKDPTKPKTADEELKELLGG